MSERWVTGVSQAKQGTNDESAQHTYTTIPWQLSVAEAIHCSVYYNVAAVVVISTHVIKDIPENACAYELIKGPLRVKYPVVRIEGR